MEQFLLIFPDLCRAVGVEVVQNLELFSDRVPVQSLRSQNQQFRGIIRSYSECEWDWEYHYKNSPAETRKVNS